MQYQVIREAGRLAIALAIVAATLPAQAYDPGPDRPELPWPFASHEYGGDVTRPGATPDRPYWHGDDAIPLGLRWRDRGWEGSDEENLPPPVDPRAEPIR